jgi:hypothetical protein
MPRRDGFPTNQEMVVDFNNLSRTAYVDAFQRLSENGLPDAYQDKPLDLMYLDAAKRVPESMRVDGAVVDEKLHVRTLEKDDVDYLPDTLGFKDTPEDVLGHYYDVARRIGDVTLHDGLDIATVLPSEGIVADYTAFYPNGRTRHISTFKEKPSKASIVAGKYFAEQAIQEINTPFEDKHFDLTDLAKVAASMQNLSDQGGIVRHSLSFYKVPNLPLNGHESKGFLNNYANNMLDRTMRSAARLERMKDLGAPELVIENAQAIYDEANSSYLRAQAFLDKK